MRQVKSVLMKKKSSYDELEKRLKELESELLDCKRAKEELRERVEWFRTQIDYSYNWEWWIGPDGKYIYVSASCERITG